MKTRKRQHSLLLLLVADHNVGNEEKALRLLLQLMEVVLAPKEITELRVCVVHSDVCKVLQVFILALCVCYLHSTWGRNNNNHNAMTTTMIKMIVKLCARREQCLTCNILE